MAWPPPIPPQTRSDSTAQLSNHPDDHNQIAGALNELVARSHNIQFGRTQVAVDSGGTGTITFPTPFPSIPVMVGTVQLNTSSQMTVDLRNISATGATVSIYSSGSIITNDSRLVHWIAIEA